MVRSIVTGKYRGKGEGVKVKGVSGNCRMLLSSTFSPLPIPLLPCARWRAGFTLLELMIVITIVIILAAIVLPQYQKTILATREAVLREDLYKMRTLLDQYAADKQKLPQSLDDLVAGGYLRELPKDPITGQADWTVLTGEDPNSSGGESGVIDVHSASTDTSSEGTPYSEW
jgi:general secretion pathway protein G